MWKVTTITCLILVILQHRGIYLALFGEQTAGSIAHQRFVGAFKLNLVAPARNHANDEWLRMNEKRSPKLFAPSMARPRVASSVTRIAPFHILSSSIFRLEGGIACDRTSDDKQFTIRRKSIAGHREETWSDSSGQNFKYIRHKREATFASILILVSIWFVARHLNISDKSNYESWRCARNILPTVMSLRNTNLLIHRPLLGHIYPRAELFTNIVLSYARFNFLLISNGNRSSFVYMEI